MYRLARTLLFLLPTETSHHLSLAALAGAHHLGLLRGFQKQRPQVPTVVMGLEFPNPFGLAAGLDKNGDYFNALGALGFGFVEIGTVTPRAQAGNPKPRLFRLPGQQAIINRMGFNNLGVDHLVNQVRKRRYDGVLGINIGKNLSTSMTDAVQDYLYCMDRVYEVADYIAVNISSPNTPGLRDLQGTAQLDELLRQLKARQHMLADKHGRYVPLAVKIAPDQGDEQVRELATVLIKHRIDGVIATNTTTSRAGVERSRHGAESGGLSGTPLAARATQVVRVLASALDGALPVIAVGGIGNGQGAVDKLRAGASLVQIYSGFIYRGPGLLAEMAQATSAMTQQR